MTQEQIDELAKDVIENIEVGIKSLAINDHKPRMALLQSIDQIKRLAGYAAAPAYKGDDEIEPDGVCDTCGCIKCCCND